MTTEIKDAAADATASAVQSVANAIYFLEQVAIDARDEWRLAKTEGKEDEVKDQRRLKVKIHNLKKQAVMSLASQGFATIKGYYMCVAAYGEPHLVAIEVNGLEFLIPIKKKISKSLEFLGEVGLVNKDNSFESNLSVEQAFLLVNTYLNPNYEEDMKKFAKKRKPMHKKSYKKNNEKRS